MMMIIKLYSIENNCQSFWRWKKVRANQDIRQEAKAARLTLWQIAEALNISEPTMTRWLRKELPEEEKAKIFEAIKSLRREVV